jgi:hypothetical protein
MSMYPQELGTIPAETARVARAAYPKGTLAMRLRDALGGSIAMNSLRGYLPAADGRRKRPGV